MTQTESAEVRIYLLDLIYPLIRRRWMIFAIISLAAGWGGFNAYRLPPEYVATVSFAPIGVFGADVLSTLVGTGSDWKVNRTSSEIMDYYSAVMKSQALMEKLLSRKFSTLRSGETRLLEYLIPQPKEAEPMTSKTAESLRELGIYKARGLIAVKGSSSRIITVECSMPESALAADVANALFEEFERLPTRKQRVSTEMQLVEKLIEETETRITDVQTTIALRRSRILDAKSPDRVIMLDALQRDLQDLIKVKESLTSEYERAQLRLIQNKQAGSREIEVIDPAMPPLRPSPARLKLFTKFLALGALLALALALGLEYYGYLRIHMKEHPFWSYWPRTIGEIALMAGAFVILLLAILHVLQ
ncbi:MAG: hypothetical protein NTX50_19445 [Candidatus Sumerlaeota bacterium]|nr:hypothetical protein [Candidatus Sumerlaeota bacterium]